MKECMERIREGRRDITIHGSADKSDVPVTRFPDDARIASETSFVPVNMDKPTLYTGDVIVGVTDGEITFGELIYDKTDDAVMVDPLDSGRIIPIADPQFSSRFYQADEIHIYDGVVDELVGRTGIEFDESKIQREETRRPR